MEAEAFALEAQGEPWMKVRGWSGVSRAPSASSAVQPSGGLFTESSKGRSIFTLTLADLAEIIPPEDGGPPLSHLHITEAVRKGGFENVLKDGYSIGWWTRLPKLGAYQANILGRVDGFNPDAVYGLLSKREEWTNFYPGFYLVERARPLTAGQGIYRLAMKTPAGKIRMFTKHTIVPSEFQVRWEKPSEDQERGLELGTEPGEQVIARIQGSITAAPAPSGNGSLLLYELFMTAQQTGAVRQVDPFADLQRGQLATMARVPPLLTSLSAKLAANRDGTAWGISDAAQMAAYRDSPDPLKGPVPAGVSYHPKVWVVEK